MEDSSREPLIIRPETRERPVTIVQVPRIIAMHSVSEAELDSVASGQTSVHLGFFGVVCGAAISFTITLLTVEITSWIVQSSFVGILSTSLLLTVYFVVRAFGDYRQRRRIIASIKATRRQDG